MIVMVNSFLIGSLCANTLDTSAPSLQLGRSRLSGQTVPMGMSIMTSFPNATPSKHTITRVQDDGARVEGLVVAE